MASWALLSGYSGLHPEKNIEAAAVAPNPLAADLALNGVWLSDVPHQLSIRDQSYDFAHGELTSRVRFHTQGGTADIEVLTLRCRHQPTLVTQEIAITLDSACDLKIQALVDTRQINGRLKSSSQDGPGGSADFDGSLLWQSEGEFSQCGIALVSALLGDTDTKREAPGGSGRSPLLTQYGLRAPAGKIYHLRQIASLVPSVMHNQPNRHADRLAALGAHDGFDKLRQANRAEWRELWKGRILLRGAGRYWQQLADTAFTT